MLVYWSDIKWIYFDAVFVLVWVDEMDELLGLDWSRCRGRHLVIVLRRRISIRSNSSDRLWATSRWRTAAAAAAGAADVCVSGVEQMFDLVARDRLELEHEDLEELEYELARVDVLVRLLGLDALDKIEEHATTHVLQVDVEQRIVERAREIGLHSSA